LSAYRDRLILYAIDSASDDVFPDVGRLEVVEIGWRGRWSDDEKERIVGEAFANGSSVRPQPASQQFPFLVTLRPYDRASGDERVRRCPAGAGRPSHDPRRNRRGQVLFAGS
jgi:hypothetical protein